MNPPTGLLAKPRAEDLPQTGRVPFYVDFPFTRQVIASEEQAKSLPQLPADAKVEPKKGDLVLVGYASTWVEDRDREFISRRAYDKTLDAYLKNNPIVLWQHMRDKSFGQVAEGDVDDFGLATKSVVRQPEAGEDGWRISAFNDVKAGIVRTHSVGGFFEREIIEGEVLITEIELFEISCVSIPSNPLSIYEASMKAVHGLPMRDSQAAVGQMVQLLSLEPIMDPQLAHLSERQREARYHELASIFVESKGVSAPDFNAYRELLERVNGGTDTQKELDDLYAMLQVLATPDQGALGDLPGQAVKHGEPGEKKGRVLSKSNEAKLRRAHEDIGTVLSKVAEAPEAEEGKTAKQLYSSLYSHLRDAGREHFKAGKTRWVYVEDFDLDEDWAVYRVINEGSSEDRLVKIDFTRQEDGTVKLGGNETDVEISYTSSKGLNDSERTLVEAAELLPGAQG